HQIQSRCVHLLALLAHGTRVIDHDTHGDGDVFLAERGNGLEMPVLVDVEIALIESGDDALLVVDDSGVQHHFLDILAENEDAAVGGIRILPLIRSGIRSGALPRGAGGGRAPAAADGEFAGDWEPAPAAGGDWFGAPACV